MTNREERSIIALLMMGGDAKGPLSTQVLAASDFRSEFHQDVWEAIEGLRAEGRPVDIITAADWIYRMKGEQPAIHEQLLDLMESDIDSDDQACISALLARRKA
jgi:replicative DNA helicase